MSFVQLDNPVQTYDWGSRSAIAELLDLPNPKSEPQAELWMGTHALGSSRRHDDGVSLRDWVAGAPAQCLGPNVVERFGPRLPYLFKVLAAATPLSLQVHPDATQAREGFARESLAPPGTVKNYADASHKPELLCALTDFEALCGFREPGEALRMLTRFGLTTDPRNSSLDLESARRLAEPLARLQRSDDDAFRGLLAAAFSLDTDARHRLTTKLGEAATTLLLTSATRGQASGDELFRVAFWVRYIAERHPGDVGVLGALLLNLVHLNPGEAIYLPARHLHAYLVGAGLEIMASSDNVLRGGLTRKHVDVPELLRILSPLPYRPSVLCGESVDVGHFARETTYRTAAAEFELSLVELRDGTFTGGQGPEIVLCLQGELMLHRTGNVPLRLTRGQSAFCASNPSTYSARGIGRFARAKVPT